MSNRTLNQEQIEKLFVFCEERNVKYYDVQIELVDHLACSIEQKWEKNPALSFEDALRAEFMDFYYNGLSKTVENKEEALKEKYKSQQRKYIREFFLLPKVIISMAVCLSFYTIFIFLPNYLIVAACLNLVYMLLVLSYLLFLFPQRYKIDLIPGKTFLLSTQIKLWRRNNMMISYLPYSVIGTIISSNRIFHIPFMDSFLLKLFFALVFTFSSIVAYAVCFYIPQRIKEDFTREYPQFLKS